MGLWIDILKAGACGERDAARDLLEQVPALLRGTAASDNGDGYYTGVLPLAVRKFVASLQRSEQAKIRPYENELVDYIIDGVQSSIRYSLVLIELCYRQPNARLDYLVAVFPWDPALKRSNDWKRQWVADMLRSMQKQGVPVPAGVLRGMERAGNPRYPLDEVRYAASRKRLEYSWQDFQEELGLSQEFVSADESELDSGIAAEMVDYGGNPVARIMLGRSTVIDIDILLDLRQFGAELGPELTALMEGLHAEKPKEGYRPIAWHNVFWVMNEEYGSFAMDLRTLSPFCESSDKLAERIRNDYAEVLAHSRPVISRRRQRLQDAVCERIVVKARERFSASANTKLPESQKRVKKQKAGVRRGPVTAARGTDQDTA